MPTPQHSQFGKRLSGESVNQLQQRAMPSMGSGLELVSSSQGNVIAFPPAAHDTGMYIRQSFMGRIVKTGPNDEVDFDDAQYWVRRVDPKWSGDDDRLEFYNDPPNNPREPGEDKLDRHVVIAENMNEVVPYERELESHMLGVHPDDHPNRGRVVRVHLLFEHVPHDTEQRKRVRSRWIFYGQFPTWRWCVCRTAVKPNDNFVEIETISWNAKHNEWRFDGFMFTALVRPSSRARHFMEHVTDTVDINSDITVLRCEFGGLGSGTGAWFVDPYLKMTPMGVDHKSKMRISDCFLPIE